MISMRTIIYSALCINGLLITMLIGYYWLIFKNNNKDGKSN